MTRSNLDATSRPASASDEHDPSKEDHLINVRQAPSDPATDGDGAIEDDHIVRGLE